ncbi:hypothetical protein L596_029613 [Steinernema carpocapsae]|uniref:Uncharacterized protein n=1 Tax=Steinernema carpocapsae TaxID=34508 RepID=A0A4U5LV59_STECR|nr:hypothetical protein L596_029613 [Steinernema carpocapsae]
MYLLAIQIFNALEATPDEKFMGSFEAVLFSQYKCPWAAASEILYCAAQGRDHANAARNGVANALAGQKCLLLCNPVTPWTRGTIRRELP